MRKYTCTGFKSVLAESLTSAAWLFAYRAAKRRYGRSGYCRTCVQQAYAEDMRLAEYSAFIGTTTDRNETTGHNIMFTVHAS